MTDDPRKAYDESLAEHMATISRALDREILRNILEPYILEKLNLGEPMNQLKTYRPAIPRVQAIQYTGSPHDLLTYLGFRFNIPVATIRNHTVEFEIKTSRGTFKKIMDPGDWLVCLEDNFEVMSEKSFRAKYEEDPGAWS